MALTPSRRTSYEAALRRASTAILVAEQALADSGSQEASDELSLVRAWLDSCRAASVEERRPGKAPAPIPGQTEIQSQDA